MRAVSRWLFVAAAAIGWASNVLAQPALPLSTSATAYRVFLSSGEPLPSHGEPVFVDDRVIFNLLVDPGGAEPGLQLVSLPLASVDGARTAGYTHAMRAAHYGATLGEADYLMLTSEVARALTYLESIPDRREKLTLAERARRQLLAWPGSHYQYRANDIRELAALFDGVIAELRAAVGAPGLALDFVAGAPPLEPLLPPPSLREAVALALRAAGVADNGVERVEILRRASDAADRLGDERVRQTIDTSLLDEERAAALYASLFARVRTAVERARLRGDVGALEAALRTLDDGDVELGRRRPADVRDFRASLVTVVESVRWYREALDLYAVDIAGRRRYASRLRPLLQRFDRAADHLSLLREMKGVTPSQLASLERTLVEVSRDLDRLDPPPALVGVQVGLRNAVLIAREAALRRRQARSSAADQMRESSAAAAGALLLAGQVRRDLEAALRRPSIQ